MTSTELVIKATGEIATPDTLNAYLTRVLETVPTQDEGDISGILTQIVNAGSVDELDSPWQSAGLAKYLNHALNITRIKRLESDYPGGLGWYLLCEGEVMATGEYKAFSTSSVAAMAMLLVAYDRGWFPYKCYIKIATKPTKKGFYPMHLETYRGGPLVLENESPAPGPRHIPGARAASVPRRGAAGPFDPHTTGATEPPVGHSSRRGEQ
jgi:hypothetical protein